MKASKTDINNLKKIQEVDAQIKTVKSSVKAMPEIKEFALVSEKLKEVSDQLKKVELMKKNVTKRYEKMRVEDQGLIDRERSVQCSIDDAAGDYRNLEVHTKELDSITSRRKTLAELMKKANEEEEKVSKLAVKLKSAKEHITAKKAALNVVIEKARADEQVKLDELAVSRKKVHDKLPSDLAFIYDDAVSKVGNVVLAGLDSDRCSVCRTPIEEGKLLEIQNAGEIAVCPSCGRIMIVEGD